MFTKLWREYVISIVANRQPHRLSSATFESDRLLVHTRRRIFLCCSFAIRGPAGHTDKFRCLPAELYRYIPGRFESSLVRQPSRYRHKNNRTPPVSGSAREARQGSSGVCREEYSA